MEEEGEKRLAIPITVRQLEAVVRISESLAKMALQPFVTDANVEEALRIFQVNYSALLVKWNISRHPLSFKVIHKILCTGFNPVGCTFRGPRRCRGLHH